MYIAPVDAGTDESEWRGFVTRQGFGHLAVCGPDLPVVVPTQFVLSDDEVLLHLVARNPIFDALAERPLALLSVAGDWAFIPSDWKAIGEEDPLLGIPTTYYGAVQLSGPVTVVDDPAELAAILRRQLADAQPGVAVATPEAAHGSRLPSIRGLRLQIEQVRAKFKYGGNVDAPHRRAVAERLVARGGPGDAVAAAHTLRRLA